MSLSGQLKVYLNGRQPTYGEEFSKVPRTLLYAAIKKLEENSDQIAKLQQTINELTDPDNLPPAA